MFRDKLLKLLLISTFNQNSEINAENLSTTPMTEKDNEKIEKLLDLVVDKNITLRPFTSYCIRYLFNENCIDDMIENVTDLTGPI
jgi:hypothetical protein